MVGYDSQCALVVRDSSSSYYGYQASPAATRTASLCAVACVLLRFAITIVVVDCLHWWWDITLWQVNSWKRATCSTEIDIWNLLWPSLDPMLTVPEAITACQHTAAVPSHVKTVQSVY